MKPYESFKHLDEKLGTRDFEILLKKHLRPRELFILQQRYYEGGRTLKAIGDDLGVTKERIRQLEGRAFRKLREASVLLFDERYLPYARKGWE